MILIVSCLYLVSALFRKKAREGEAGGVSKKSVNATKVQESARSFALRSRFSVPESGKISISINRVS
ncbi:hypothetical protein EON65_42910 [archaeon]|nr:MAG: hypothetical protein EON65_42910 [archaeon]